MKPQEFRASAALAAVFSVRLLGLFIIYPVFPAYAGTLAGANPYLIGEALGIYGLTLYQHIRVCSHCGASVTSKRPTLC